MTRSSPSLDIEAENLEQAETFFATCLFGAKELSIRAFMMLHQIKERQLWKEGGFKTFKVYMEDFQGRIREASDTLPVSFSQMWQRLRYIKRAEALDISPEDLLGYPHPSVIDEAFAVATWDREGNPTGIRNPAVEEELEKMYGEDAKPAELVAGLVEDSMALPSVSEAKKLLEDVSSSGTEILTYEVNTYNNRVITLTAWVERRDNDGTLRGREKHNLLLDQGTPDFILEDLYRRLDVYRQPPESEEVGDLFNL